MKKFFTLTVLFFVASALAAPVIPVVTNVRCAQGARFFTVTYNLSHDAIVTLDIVTNGVSIGEKAFAAFNGKGRRVVSGDAFCRVSAGKDRLAKWDVRAVWPDRSVDVKAVVTAWPLNDKPPYMVVDISPDFSGPDESRFSYYATAEGVPGGITENFLYKTNAIVFKRVYARARDYHAKLTNDFYLAVFETTQAQWACVNGSVSARFTKNGWGRPMDGATYCQMRLGPNHNSNYNTTEWNYPAEPNEKSFLGMLRARCGNLCDFDIPLKDEWVFAALAGEGNGYWGDGTPVTTSGNNAAFAQECPNLNFIGRYSKNGGFVPSSKDEADNVAENDVDNGTAIVGTYKSNNWGFYDMHGNVCERVHLPDGDARVVMGGDCHDNPEACRAVMVRSDVGITAKYYSYSSATYVGFRISCRNGLK